MAAPTVTPAGRRSDSMTTSMLAIWEAISMPSLVADWTASSPSTSTSTPKPWAWRRRFGKNTTSNLLDDPHETSSVNKSNFSASEFLYKQVTSTVLASTPSDELTEAAKLDETSVAKPCTSAAASESNSTCRLAHRTCRQTSGKRPYRYPTL